MPRSASSAVADAGPLIALGRLDLLGLLPALFAEVLVPDAVLAECKAQPHRLDSQRVSTAVERGLLVPSAAHPVSSSILGAGERCAIGKALEIGGVLVADDLAARRHASAAGLVVIGTLGVLVRAKREGLIDVVSPLVARLRESGYWIGEAAVSAALIAAGERAD